MILRSIFFIIVFFSISTAFGSVGIPVTLPAQSPHFTYGFDPKPLSLTITIDTPGFVKIAETMERCSSLHTFGIIALGLAICYVGYKRIEKDKPWEGWPLLGVGASLVCMATWIAAQIKQMPTWG